MAIQHVKVVAGEGWSQLADRLSPDGCTSQQHADLALKIAVANGDTLSVTLHPDRILHVDDAWIPVPPPVEPPPPPPPPPPAETISETFNGTAPLANFTPLRGMLAVTGGIARPSSPNTEVDYVHKTDLGSPDHEVSVDLVVGSGTISGSWCGVCARMAATGLTYYMVEVGSDRNTLSLIKCVNGVYNLLKSWTPTGWAAGSAHKVTLQVAGNAIKVIVDGIERITHTDTSPLAGTRVGLHCYLNNTAHFGYDSFSAKKLTLTTPPPPVEPPLTSTGEFYVKNGRIGRDGKQFVAIGVNGVTMPRGMPVGDWWNDAGMGNMNGKAAAYRALGFNFVRFNDMRDYAVRPFRDWQNGLFDAIDEYTAQGVVCMPAYHRVGPGTNPTPAALDGNADFQNYWNEIIDRYKTNPMVWANPLNEPIGTAWDQWENLSNYQYNLLRSRGWTGMIVLDLPQWAQGIGARTPDQFAAFMAGKTQCVLGFHNYGMGDQTAAVQAIQAKGVAILIGEYGETLGGADRAAMLWVSAQADALGIGAVAWWGAGNRNDDYVLRQRRGATWYDTSVPLTDFGQRLFNLAANRSTQPNL